MAARGEAVRTLAATRTVHSFSLVASRPVRAPLRGHHVVCDHVGLRRTTVSTAVMLILVVAWLLQAQSPAGAAYAVVSREGRRPLPTTSVNGQDYVALDDLVSAFALTVRADALADGFTIASRGRTLIAAANQPTVSVSGRVVLLPAPVAHIARRWLVPVEFLQLALAPLVDQRIQVRRPSRLVIIGDLRVPRVTARIEGAGAGTRAVVDISPAAAVSMAADGARIILKVDGDALDLALPTDGSGLIEQMRPGEMNTIIVQLAASAGPARLSPQSPDAVPRVVLEVQPATPAATATASPPAADSGAPRQNGPAPPPVSVESLSAPRTGAQTVILDPGHGGDDSGTKSAGTQEKQLTLDIARRVRALLEMHLGVHVMLTRDGDTAVPLDARVAFANNHQGDLFLSLHANAAPSPAVEGSEVYYLQLDREGERARADAARTALAIPVIGGGTRTLDLIPWELAQARHLEASAMFANALAANLGARIPPGPSPVRTAPLRVLEGVNMPAALVEIAFLSSPAQAKLARSDAFKEMTAQGLYDAIVAFRRQSEETRPR